MLFVVNSPFHKSVPNPSLALKFIKSVNSEAISWQTYGMPLTQNVWISLICIAITITTLIYFSNNVMEKKKKSPVSALFIICIDNVNWVVEFFWLAQNKFLNCWPKINTHKGNYRIYCIKKLDKQNRRKSKNKSWYLVFGKLLIQRKQH